MNANCQFSTVSDAEKFGCAIVKLLATGVVAYLMGQRICSWVAQFEQELRLARIWEGRALVEVEALENLVAARIFARAGPLVQEG